MNITPAVNQADPSKANTAGSGAGFDLYAEMFAELFPTSDTAHGDVFVSPFVFANQPRLSPPAAATPTVEPADSQQDEPLEIPALPGENIVGLEETFAPVSAKTGKSDDEVGFDLYAELFAAFFPVQITPISSKSIQEAIADPETVDLAADPAAMSDFDADAPRMLPTGATIAADAAEFSAAAAVQAHADSSEKISPPIDGSIEQKLKTLANQPGKVMLQTVAPDERFPAGKGEAVVGVTPTGNKSENTVISQRSAAEPVVSDIESANDSANWAAPVSTDSEPVAHGHQPRTIRSTVDQPGTIEVLEIPAPQRHERSDRQQEPILELPVPTAEQPSSPPNIFTGRESAPVIPAVPAAMQHFRAFSHNTARARFRAEAVATEARAPEQVRVHTRTLLEAFTNRVLADARTSQSARTFVSDGLDADTAAPAWTEHLSEKEKTAAPADFGFDTSVGGEARAADVDRPQISDSKMRRAVLDQVAPQLNEMAAAQKPGDDKRVLTIKLSPAELGTVEITLSKNADGIIDAHFQTDNPHAQHAINETLAQLRDSLERSGVQVGSLNTSCTSSHSNPQGGADGRDTKQFAAAGSTAQPVAPAESPTRIDGDADRLVSLRA